MLAQLFYRRLCAGHLFIDFVVPNNAVLTDTYCPRQKFIISANNTIALIPLQN